MKLIQYLDSRHLIHAKFAERCGIKRSAFCRYVNGSRKPPADLAMKIKKESRDLVTEFDTIIKDYQDLMRDS